MAETVAYYPNLNITAYPTSASQDEGKINLEQNMAKIVTRITERNYALTEGSFNLTLDPDTTYNQVISIAPGQANIQGYHVITTSTLRVPPPTEIEPGNHIVIGMRLGRELASDNLLGDVTEMGETRYEGVWVSYFEYEDPMDPDIFILGYLDWDGSKISNVVDNPEKYGRIDAEDIIVYLSDPKHPEYEFLTLQELADNLKDWYVSKLGDDEYGEILWRTDDKPTDPDNWGVSVVADNPGKSTITVKPSLVTDTEHTIVITSDYTRPLIKIGDAEIWTLSSDMTLQTVRDLILDAGRNIVGIAQEQIINKIDAENSLTTTLDKNNFTLSSGLNDNNINFTIDETNLKFKLGDGLFDYSTVTKYLTISGLQRLMIDNPAEFKSDTRIDQTLYFGNTPFVDSYINKDNLKFTTNKNYVINLGDDGSGLNIKSETSGTEPKVRVENKEGAYAELTTDKNDASLNLKANGNGTTYINFKGGDPQYDNYFYKLPDDNAIHVKKDFAVDGEIRAGKVWNAVYN